MQFTLQGSYLQGARFSTSVQGLLMRWSGQYMSTGITNEVIGHDMSTGITNEVLGQDMNTGITNEVLGAEHE